ncbi:MAG: hypothetical protein JSU72_10975 [Deltaproteobacteria bacterium]|nr:MAG: hypothetical protein JSU72_10975 [Deltaproteobacteria bacterium]
MKWKQYGLMLTLALLTGLVGGVVSSRFCVVDLALAGDKFEPQKVVAREFRLVDDNGKTIAILGGRPGKEPFLPIAPDLRFYGKDGELRILVGLMPGDNPVIVLSDADRDVIWKAP